MASTQGSSPRTNRKVITILSIDGGGGRGIIPAVILSALEAELQVFSYHILLSFHILIFFKIVVLKVLAEGVLAKAKRGIYIYMHDLIGRI